MPIHVKLVWLLQFLRVPNAVPRNVKELLNSAGFVVIAKKNWGGLPSVKPAVDLSSVCQAHVLVTELD